MSSVFSIRVYSNTIRAIAGSSPLAWQTDADKALLENKSGAVEKAEGIEDRGALSGLRRTRDPA